MIPTRLASIGIGESLQKRVPLIYYHFEHYYMELNGFRDFDYNVAAMYGLLLIVIRLQAFHHRVI